MKRNSLLLLVSIFLAFTGSSFGQTSTATTAVIPSVAFDIAAQPDSPLAISLETNRVISGMPGVPLRITNTSSSTVVAYVLLVKAVPMDQSQMAFLGKGVGPGGSNPHGLNLPPVANGSGRPVVSVDYVQFDDGRGWGDDTLGKSKNIQEFLAGRSLALSRLKELLAGQDDADFMKLINGFHLSTVSEPVFPAGRPAPRTVDFSAKGYDEILNILRRMPKRADEAKELARKLELMQLQ